MRRSGPACHVLLSALGLLSIGSICLGTHDAQAQFGPGGGMSPMGGGGRGGMGGPGGGMGGGGMGGGGAPPDKPEGPAEAAPGQTTGDVATEPLPEWRDKKEKSLQFFQLNGYLRGRGYYWYNFNLGTFNDPALRANPFSAPYSEIPDANGAAQSSSCSKRGGAADCLQRDIRTADMRFRLDPVLNLSEQVRVRAQLDIFDNLVLGSTPDGFYINGRGGAADGYPGINSRSQQTSETAVNALQSSIRAKRVWGEVKIPLVELSFGRMPFHFGSGMLFNDGNCMDCDFGTTVDRIMVTARHWNHFVSFAYDWAATGPTSAIVNPQSLTGWNYNLDNVDDVNQYTLVLGRTDEQSYIDDQLKQGKAVINYAGLVMARTQDWDLVYNPRPQTTLSTMTGPDNPSLYSPNELQKSLGRRAAWSLTADLWARLQWKKLFLEVEGVGTFGQIGELGLYNSSTSSMTDATLRKAELSLQQLGGMARGRYKFLKDALVVGLEVGSASGPQNGDPNAELNYRRAKEAAVGQLDPSNGLLQLRSSRFTFDPDFHVDMILFRRILGTVYNATYLKPAVTYWLLDDTANRPRENKANDNKFGSDEYKENSFGDRKGAGSRFGGQAEFIYSMANRPATFPGHSVNLGAEINLRLMYQNLEEGFYATLEYGVLFDLGGLQQKPEIWDNTRRVDATIAQAFQAKIALKF